MNDAARSCDLNKAIELGGLLIKSRGGSAPIGPVDASDQRVREIHPPRFVIFKTGPHCVVVFHNAITAGKQVYTDLSWAIGFVPRWLAAEIDRRGLGHDRVLFASDEPWGDHASEVAKLRAAAAGSELSRAVFQTTFDKLYG